LGSFKTNTVKQCPKIKMNKLFRENTESATSVILFEKGATVQSNVEEKYITSLL
jgi:hypothetical protein